MVLAWLESALDRVLREHCAHCGEHVQALAALYCANCHAQCRPAPPREVVGVPALARFLFEGPIRETLHRFKYGGQPELARRLARATLLSEGLHALRLDGAAVFVPVPIHPERLVSRGYNQSALLATRLAQYSGGRLAVRALARRSNTRRQVTLSREERDLNLKDQIVARGPLRGRVVLVDDVLTTGATARACFDALRVAGAIPVAVVTVASAD